MLAEQGTAGPNAPGAVDATGMPLLTKALLDAGFSKSEIRQIMGENYLRLLLATLPDK